MVAFSKLGVIQFTIVLSGGHWLNLLRMQSIPCELKSIDVQKKEGKDEYNFYLVYLIFV